MVTKMASTHVIPWQTEALQYFLLHLKTILVYVVNAWFGEYCCRTPATINKIPFTCLYSGPDTLLSIFHSLTHYPSTEEDIKAQ